MDQIDITGIRERLKGVFATEHARDPSHHGYPWEHCEHRRCLEGVACLGVLAWVQDELQAEPEQATLGASVVVGPAELVLSVVALMDHAGVDEVVLSRDDFMEAMQAGRHVHPHRREDGSLAIELCSGSE